VTAELKAEEEKTGQGEDAVSDFVVPGGDEEENEKKKNSKKIQKKMKLEKDENDDDYGYDSDEEENSDDDDDDDYGDFDFTDGEEEDEEEMNKKFSLKAFVKQPTVLLSDGISVSLFLTKKENTDLTTDFDAEKYGKDFLADRKALANLELEKLAKEIKELDEELDEKKSEGEKEVVVKVVLEGEKADTEKVEKIVVKDAATILKEEIKEIEKENRRRTEERESILNFLLFSVLDGDMNIDMKINGKGEKTETETVIISVKQNENENENENGDENKTKKISENNQVQDVLNSKNTNIAVYTDSEKGKDKDKSTEKEEKEELTTVLFQAGLLLNPLKYSENETTENTEENSKINKIGEETKSKMKMKKLNYFASPESVLGPTLIVAFEVRYYFYLLIITFHLTAEFDDNYESSLTDIYIFSSSISSFDLLHFILSFFLLFLHNFI
jgi:hypothetical protein